MARPPMPSWGSPNPASSVGPDEAASWSDSIQAPRLPASLAMLLSGEDPYSSGVPTSNLEKEPSGSLSNASFSESWMYSQHRRAGARATYSTSQRLAPSKKEAPLHLLDGNTSIFEDNGTIDHFSQTSSSSNRGVPHRYPTGSTMSRSMTCSSSQSTLSTVSPTTPTFFIDAPSFASSVSPFGRYPSIPNLLDGSRYPGSLPTLPRIASLSSFDELPAHRKSTIDWSYDFNRLLSGHSGAGNGSSIQPDFLAQPALRQRSYTDGMSVDRMAPLGGGGGGMPFVCPGCNRPFARKHDMKRHLRKHTGEKPYECATCKERFNRPDALQRHYSLHPSCRL